MQVPGRNLPLSVPFLCIHNFSALVKQFVQTFRLRFHQQFLPFHLPSKAVREAAHPKVCQSVFTYKQWLSRTSISGLDHISCNCDKIRSRHPKLDLTQGHVASSASKLSAPENILALVSCSSSSSYFCSQGLYLEETTRAVVNWARHHNVSDSVVPVLWGNFIKQIWPQHLESVQQQRSFCVQDVMQFRQIAKQLVCHNADHEPFHVHLFCPKIYLQTVAKTWSDPEVFVRVDQTVQQVKDSLKDMVSPRFQTLYNWGFNFKADLPYGYCFLKHKKQWTTARTIVSYCASAMSKLMTAFAMLLRDICSTVWQDSLSALKAPQMWRALHIFWIQLP
jgi:hypothetical protein